MAEVVNRDPAVAGRLRVVFLPDYNVKNCQRIFPAADLSEQISTAGKEASGTGNMKFAMNGALTIGTLDGANVEIREEVGAENFFLFGLTADEVQRAAGRRLPAARLLRARRRAARRCSTASRSGVFSRGDRGLFRPLVDYAARAATRSCCSPTSAPTSSARTRSTAPGSDAERWTRMSILNVARMGRFSSDRAIREYCRDIWTVAPSRSSSAQGRPDGGGTARAADGEAGAAAGHGIGASGLHRRRRRGAP